MDLNSEVKRVDLIIKGATIVTMDSHRSIVDEGSVIIHEGNIVGLVAGADSIDNITATKTINGKGQLLMPGLINTHTHTAMTLFRGLADDIALQEWLGKHIFPAEKAHINPQSVAIGTRLAVIEMIQAGTTCFNDMYFFSNEVATVAQEIGMRAVVSEGIIDFSTPSHKTPKDALSYTKSMIGKWQDEPLITIAVACHAPYTCSAKTLSQAKELATEYDTLYHIHIAETQTEVDTIRKQHGCTPVQYLNSLALVDDKLIAVHAVYLTIKEVALLADKKAGISHNPSSNMKLASGIAPMVHLHEAGACLSLGTDSAASNNNLDLFKEISLVAKIHKVENNNPLAITAQNAVEMATIGGAQVLGLADKVGSIEVGKAADLIMINMHKPHLIPCYNVYSHLAYAVKGSDVETTIINGRIIMENKKMLTVDENDAMGAVVDYAKRIKST